MSEPSSPGAASWFCVTSAIASSVSEGVRHAARLAALLPVWWPLAVITIPFNISHYACETIASRDHATQPRTCLMAVPENYARNNLKSRRKYVAKRIDNLLDGSPTTKARTSDQREAQKNFASRIHMVQRSRESSG